MITLRGSFSVMGRESAFHLEVPGLSPELSAWGRVIFLQQINLRKFSRERRLSLSCIVKLNEGWFISWQWGHRWDCSMFSIEELEGRKHVDWSNVRKEPCSGPYYKGNFRISKLQGSFSGISISTEYPFSSGGPGFESFAEHLEKVFFPWRINLRISCRVRWDGFRSQAYCENQWMVNFPSRNSSLTEILYDTATKPYTKALSGSV